MANPSASTSIVALESSEQRGTCSVDSNMNPNPTMSQIDLDGPVAILWDIENCPVPSDVRPEDVAGNIRMALQVHPVIKGAVMSFSAFGDFNAFPRRLREGCQRTGVKLVDVPNGRKDAADKAILVDMFLFALDNPPPSSIMLISGDVDFAPALHILGQRGYTIILVIPSGVGVSSALCNAGKFVWDWPSVARGEGFLPPSKALMPPRGGWPADVSGHLAGCCINETLSGQNEEEAIVYRGISRSFCNSRDYSIIAHSLTEYNTGAISMSSYPAMARSESGFNEVNGGVPSALDQNNPTAWVQPGDLNGLKGQLVKLLELAGGCLPLTRIPSEYLKSFGRPLYVSEYGAVKLVNLFRKMSDAIAVDGKGHRKFVYLRNWKAGPNRSEPPSASAGKGKKVRGFPEESGDVITGCSGSSEEFSDEDRVLMEEQRNKSEDQSLQEFKYELQEILVSYSCRIFLGCFETVYEQRYKRPLDYRKLRVEGLEELFKKMRDVVNLHEDPVSKRKFISAICGSVRRSMLVILPGFVSSVLKPLLDLWYMHDPVMRSPLYSGRLLPAWNRLCKSRINR
ncbi:hypothetical protein CRG98_046074 [Punica granatum]|uniref:HTH OST-type domain-containing protein n=1 Tax=Punica granatum TaxID=22663 RepID=A0A2I0HP88_PUNGR|nr:hypothetical protein CRG98_046074 [Punica granatum]